MSLDLPTPFVQRVRRQLGDGELEPFLAALVSPRTGLRVNTLKVTPEALAARLGIHPEPVPGVREGWLVDDEVRWGSHPYHAAGLFYLQDPGAMAVGAAMDPRPGERVLDLSAAPGGKATHLAARMGGRGVLVGNDVVASRALELVGNLERFGVIQALVTRAEPHRIAERFGAAFDRVLVDAPCSGESMFHKSAAAVTDWSEAAVQGCAVRQREIVQHAAELVRPGGTLVYSTCTFAPEENQGVVQSLLERGDFAVELAIPGGEDADGSGTLLWPHRFPGAGHFIARLRRDAGADARLAPAPPPIPAVSGDVRAAVEDFHDAVFGEPLAAPERLARFGDSVVLLPEATAELGPGDLRSGLELGRMRKGRFEPAHALAMRAGGPEAVLRVDLELDDPRVGEYLAGEVIAAPGEAGWAVVHVDRFALGWGKRSGDRVKNHYPKGLRRRR